MDTANRMSRAAAAPRRIAVLYILDDFPDPHSGTEGQFWMLFRRLDATRFDARIALLRHSEFLAREVADGRLRTLNIIRISSWRAFAAAFAVAWRARREGVRIAHVIFNDSSILFPAVLAICGIRVIVSRRDLGFSYSATMLRLLRLNRRFVSRVVANCEAVKRASVRAEGYPPAAVEVIYNGLHEDDGAVMDLHARCALPSGRRVIVIVANLRPIKRMTDAIEALAQVCGQVTNAVLVIAGADRPGVVSQSHRAELEELARRLGVGERVRFLGKVADSMAVMRGADLCLLCSETEGLSNTVMEYMAAGKPVVCTDVGGNRELVQHGQSGLIVPVGDVHAIAVSIVSLLQDPDRAARFGAAAAIRVRALCSRDAMVAAHEALYAELAP